jgi:hemin uptake protein HemP
MPMPQDHQRPPPARSEDTSAALPRIDVSTLLGEGREAILLHNGEAYRLRVTANNKLILTK